MTDLYSRWLHEIGQSCVVHGILRNSRLACVPAACPYSLKLKEAQPFSKNPANSPLLDLIRAITGSFSQGWETAGE